MAMRMAPRRRESTGFSFVGSAGDAVRQEQQQELEFARPMRQYAELIPEPGFGPLNFTLFPYQVEWYSDEVADAEEVAWMKSTQIGMCLSAQTRLLTADLRWVPLGDIELGDELMAVDESHGGVSRGRRLRVASVKAKWEVRRAAYRVVMSNSVEFVASGEHRWLCQERGGLSTRWRSVDEMRVGDRIRAVTQPWGDASYEDGWMGGVLDGEGSLRTNKQRAGSDVVIVQRRGSVYDRVVDYLTQRGYTFAEKSVLGGFTSHAVPRISLSRSDEVIRLLGQTRPSRMVDSRWWEGMAPPGMREAAWPTITAIESVGVRRLIDLQTSCATFIAEGFVSHNSAYAWRWAVRRVDQFGETTIYIFPTDTHVKDFGDERIEPAIEQSSYLRSKILPRFVRHKTLKRIGQGFLHLRGSNSKAGAQSVPATCLVFDEYDLLDQTNLPQIERRITGAQQVGRHPRVRRLGTPTLDGEGIAAAFESSDQRVWMVPCPGCGLEQQVTWEENVRWTNAPDGEVMRAGHDEYEDRKHVERAWRQCKACEAELDVAKGRWVAQKPGRRVIGFHATRLIVPNTNLRQIVVASRSTKPTEVETFENNDLGRPYSSASSQLSQEQLLAACELGGPMVYAYDGPYVTTMGVDVAGERDLNVRVDEQLPPAHPDLPNPRRALWIGRVASFADLVKLIEVFRCQVVVIDDNPERRMGKAVRSSFTPGRVLLCGYNADSDSESLVVKAGEKGSPIEGVPLSVRVNRTEAIDAMMDSIRQLRNLPLKDPPPGWFDQMRSLKRKTELDKKGRVKRLYVTTGTSGDDYAHTDVYALVATEIWRLRGGAALLNPPPRHVPDEELGFSRVRLSGGNDRSETYHAGFNEPDVL